MKIKIALFLIGWIFLPFFGAVAQVDETNAVRAVLDYPPISPTIDRQAEKSEILEYAIKIKNNLGGKASLYALVYHEDVNSGELFYYDNPVLKDETSLAKWIEFPRSVIEIASGTEEVRELRIKISPNAKEGKYRAVLFLSQGSTQIGAAELAEKINVPKIVINVEVRAHIIEKAEIYEFGPSTPILTKSPLNFSLKIKNIGNRQIFLNGEVIVYTKNGKEVGSIAVDKKMINPGNVEEFPVKVNFFGLPGRYKAKFISEYGENNKDLQDVIYFTYLPKVLLIIIIIIILGILILLTNLVNKRRLNLLAMENNRKKEKKDYVINLKK